MKVSANNEVDVVGVGLNAWDTIIRVPLFPTTDSKLEILSTAACLGGQVASAMVACQRWGLHTRYVGKIGDDKEAKLHRRNLAHEGVEAHLATVRACRSQSSYILVDSATGERTILWSRDPRLELNPRELKEEWIVGARALLVDGHDTLAATAAAQWARKAGIPVVADIDNLYLGVEVLLENVDYMVGSRNSPGSLLGEPDLLKSLPLLHARYGFRLVAATLGKHGVLAWDGSRFYYSPAFRVRSVDTTGAGDVFHGAFVYAVLQSWPTQRTLEFCCAAAALGCTAVGARSGIRPLAEIFSLLEEGARYPSFYTPAALAEATDRRSKSTGV